MSATLPTSQVFWRMMGFLRPIWPFALLTCVLVLVRIGLEAASVYLLSPAITSVTQGFKSHTELSFRAWFWSVDPSAARLRQVLMWMALSQFSLGAMAYVRSVWDTRFAMKAIAHMRSLMYDQLQHVNFSFFDRMSSGKLLNRALGDLYAIHGFINTSLTSSLDIVCSIGAYLALLYYRSPVLMWAAVLPVPAWCWVVFYFNKKSEPLYQAQQVVSDQLMLHLQDNISGQMVIKSFDAQKSQISAYQLLNESLISRVFSIIRLQSQLGPLLRAIAAVLHISLFTLCAYLIRRGDLPIGDLMIVGAAMGTILGKLQSIHGIAQAYQRAVVSAGRVLEVLDSHALRPKLDTRPPLRARKGCVEFSNVSFGYVAQAPVLRHVTCVLKAGQVTALVGPTGSGKSTLTALIARFYDPDEGSITIDRQDIRDVNLHDLRHHVGYVFQDTFLFTDTVANNIRYGRPDVSYEMLQKAAQIAHADDFIDKLPRGFETPLGEDGVQLSGGQRQRLALARALVYNPEILILDDATAALDASTESTIQERLGDALKGRTVLMITNRQSNLVLADQILVLDKGQIVQTGTHQELIGQGGLYRDWLVEKSRDPYENLFVTALEM